jgi:hypothetical protein
MAKVLILEQARQLRKVMWLANWKEGRNPLEGSSPVGVCSAVVLGCYNVRRIYRYLGEAIKGFGSGVGEVNKNRVIRIENRDVEVYGQSLNSNP